MEPVERYAKGNYCLYFSEQAPAVDQIELISEGTGTHIVVCGVLDHRNKQYPLNVIFVSAGRNLIVGNDVLIENGEPSDLCSKFKDELELSWPPGRELNRDWQLEPLIRDVMSLNEEIRQKA
ncbi:hypothetical protein [Rhizobium binae]|uniref:hypothetical protein n=1 Tax=Rhizobium binae TaxID=1138190 RepID=UPI001C82AF4E|nr:hypothetical protein [Rhizobium binae]MBX4967864.1 hypothetical protein [Rhizobium binae]